MKIKYHLNKLYWGIYYLFCPQHASLRKAIPRCWMDLDGIVDDFLDAVIISFVEDENGLAAIEHIERYERASLQEIENHWGSVSDYNHHRDKVLKEYKKLAEIYTWVKSARAIEQKKIDFCYKMDDYKQLSELEKKLDEKNTEYYQDIIRLRGMLWT